MVEQDKRPRGRPVGSCLDDAATLARIADLLVSGEKSSKTAAIRRVAGPDPSGVRRLQRKFRDDQPALMNAAWRRAHARGIAVTTTRYGAPPAPRRPLVKGYGPMRLWDDLDIWCQYGLAAVGAIALFAGGLEAAAWSLGVF